MTEDARPASADCNRHVGAATLLVVATLCVYARTLGHRFLLNWMTSSTW